MHCLTTVPVIESLLDAQCTRVKDGYKFLNVLACTCRTLRDAIGKNTPTWRWARRQSLMRHAWNQWRKLTKRAWLDQVPYWKDQFRHATDEWFANDGPTYVAKTGQTCRVPQYLQPRLSRTSRLLWVSTVPEPHKKVKGQFTLADRQWNSAMITSRGNGKTKCSISLHWSIQDFLVGAHVYSGASRIDHLVNDAMYIVGDRNHKIGHGRWRDVQHCYMPTSAAGFCTIQLEFTVDVDVDDVVVECTAFVFDLTQQSRFLETTSGGRSISFPFDRDQIIMAAYGCMTVTSMPS